MSPDTSSVPPKKAHRKPRAVKPQLLHQDQIDKRSDTGGEFGRLVSRIQTERDGHDHLSAMKPALIEAFAEVPTLNARLPIGQEVDPTPHAQTFVPIGDSVFEPITKGKHDE
jgi:hypothetical protein